MSGSEPTVGELLQWARTRRHVSARALSLAAGLSDSVAGKVENMRVDPALGTFARLVCALDLTDREIAFLVRVARTTRQQPGQLDAATGTGAADTAPLSLGSALGGASSSRKV